MTEMGERQHLRTRRKVILALPAYNEEPNLPVLLEAVRDALEPHSVPYEVVVVDDGSTDATADIARRYAEEMPLVLVQHEKNQGLGATLRDGLKAAVARASERDVVVTMDADATHPPGLILRMLQLIEEGFDVVIASRFQPGARVLGVSAMRRLMTRIASLLLRTLFPMGVRDFTCGYRAYRATALTAAFHRYGDAFIDQAGFQCMLDVLLKLRRFDLVMGEVPMVLRYDRKGGASKMKVWRTAWASLRLILRRRLEG
ncbi:MAG: glycosyltransferase family 2 protein [Candidatus Binatia bacterium]|nr:glycosyltransferase family 2 protein [Candidatus Binatia bacterium]